MQTVSSILNTTRAGYRTVAATDSVCTAVDRMRLEDVRSLLVLDHDQEIVGILTERDILMRVVSADRNPHEVTAAEVMTRDIVTVQATASMEDALELMAGCRHNELPVVDHGEVRGMISCREISRSMVLEREAEIGDLTYYITHG